MYDNNSLKREFDYIFPIKQVDLNQTKKYSQTMPKDLKYIFIFFDNKMDVTSASHTNLMVMLNLALSVVLRCVALL